MELKKLSEAAYQKKYLISRYGKYVLVGKGHSYFLTNDIFVDAGKLNNEVLISKFNRVVKFIASNGIGIEINEHQVAVAYYNPSDNNISFVLPGRADLNTFSHEGTHARFNIFKKILKKWKEGRNLAVPCKVDGPSVGGFASLFTSFKRCLR